METYEFKQLSHEVQKIVIEGHTEYLNLNSTHKHTYTETVNNLNLNNYKFDCRGNRIVEQSK